jgi:hypothetical protein
MKKQILSVCAAFLLIAAVGAVTAPAQSGNRLEANIPFDFIIGGKTLPAGTYAVTSPVESQNSVRLIRSAETRAAAVVMTVPTEPKTNRGPNQLVFHRYGDSYFLSQIWGDDGKVAQALPKSKLERELMASAGTPSVVMVALNSR